MKAEPSVDLVVMPMALLGAGHFTDTGVLFYSQRQFEQAARAFEQAREIEPNNARILMNLGAAYCELKRYHDALAALLKSDELRPNHSMTLCSLANVSVKLGRYAEAEAYARRALVGGLNTQTALINLSFALWGQGDLDGGIAAARDAIVAGLETSDKTAVAHKNLGVMLLLKGEFAEGWQEYDWRWPADKLPPPHPLPMPFWDGKASPLLIWCEQGLGDEILHASMIQSVIDRGIEVVLECDARLVELFQRSFPTAHVFAAGEGCDKRVCAHIPSGSLGRFVRNSAADFPAKAGYLVADKALVEEFDARLPQGLRIGIAWSSSNPEFNNHKSTSLGQWAHILGIPGVTFVDLQYGSTIHERRGFALTHFDDIHLTYGTDRVAALIETCDLVITVSNAVAHLAGALGKPALVLVPSGAAKFWYHGPSETRTIWYPSVTLMRKRTDWTALLREVEIALWEKIWAAPGYDAAH